MLYCDIEIINTKRTRACDKWNQVFRCQVSVWDCVNNVDTINKTI